MKINIVSLSGHRIDELLADYCYKAVKDNEEHEFIRDGAISDNSFDAMWVFNGLHNSYRSTAIVNRSMKITTLYFHDDWSLPTFESMLTISQFDGMGDEFFQISELSVFDERWEFPVNTKKAHGFCYWGHHKKERENNYIKFVYPMRFKKDSMFIGDFKTFRGTNIAYERDMNRLYNYISHCTHTVVFGDKHHNGKSIPLRVYEAAMNGLIVFFAKDLVKGQRHFKIDDKFIVESHDDYDLSLSYEDFKKSLLKDNLESARKRVRNNLQKLVDLTQRRVKC